MTVQPYLNVQNVQPPVAAPVADADSAAVMAKAALAFSRSQMMVEVVNSVCEVIMVSPGLLRGEGAIRIQLKPDVLDGTEISLEAIGRELSIEFHPATSDAQRILEQNIGQFEQHLAGRIHNYQIAVTMKKGKHNERI